VVWLQKEKVTAGNATCGVSSSGNSVLYLFWHQGTRGISENTSDVHFQPTLLLNW